jgi:ferredoxin
MMKSIIRFLTDDQKVETTSLGQETLLELALSSGVALSHSCGGMASCGTCRVIVEFGGEKLHSRNDLEREMANDRGFNSNERLACQICPSAELTVRLPADTEITPHKTDWSKSKWSIVFHPEEEEE